MSHTRTAREESWARQGNGSERGGGQAAGLSAGVRCDGQRLEDLRERVEHLAHLLPNQGPITSFVHHNTLHAFEHGAFERAVVEAGRLYGRQPYMGENAYRQALATGRIRQADLEEVVRGDLKRGWETPIAGLGTRGELRLAMLQHSIHTGTDAELRWLVAESDALRRFRAELAPAARRRLIEEVRHWVMRDLRSARAGSSGDPAHEAIRAHLTELFVHFGERAIENWSDSTWEAFTLQVLWRACRSGVDAAEENAAAGEGARRADHGSGPLQDAGHLSRGQRPESLRPRDVLFQATGQDTDRLVHSLLIPLCAAYVDQGLAAWRLPERQQGLYSAFLALYGQPAPPPDRWQRGLRAEVERIRRRGLGALESIHESLEAMAVAREAEEDCIRSSLLALAGWAGILWQLESQPLRAIASVPRGSLVDFLAVRLILDRLAAAYVAESELGYRGPLPELFRGLARKEPPRVAPGRDRQTFVIFQIAQSLGWHPADLFRLTGAQWGEVLGEIEAFGETERRRLLQQAYERRFLGASLDAMAIRARWLDGAGADAGRIPRFQLVCCLDEREESFRRHVEEVDAGAETFGAAGFFGVAMHYRGAADAHFRPLCPVTIQPQHYVEERVVYTFEQAHARRTRTRRILGAALHQIHVRSRTFAGGALLSALLGPLATVPLVARVLFPRLTSRVRRTAGRLVQPPPITRLVLERSADSPGPQPGQIGYSITEMAAIVERQLQDLGVAARLSRLVILCGHGSSSLNNPHESAHDCGACAGGRGGPNARAFAQMANDPRVRALLAGRGLAIPPGTVFVGAYHNTCDDSVTYFDLDRLPLTHRDEFIHASRVIDEARKRSAHERCRRFASAPLGLSIEAALRHVEGRAEDLAQTRPEYGHATNALAIVGRRCRTRGLFLDRRAFLASYDPTQDTPDHSILARILQAVVPVCAGINLEYYFSFVDPAGYGCGTKLPHNVTSLLGVMNGAASDLRPGLPWQMVEIHEPLRLLLVVETTPEAMMRILDAYEGIGRLCRNAWFYLATLDPHSDRIHLFRQGAFEPYEPEAEGLPAAESSVAWYRGWREPLGFALIGRPAEAAGQEGP